MARYGNCTVVMVYWLVMWLANMVNSHRFSLAKGESTVSALDGPTNRFRTARTWNFARLQTANIQEVWGAGRRDLGCSYWCASSRRNVCVWEDQPPSTSLARTTNLALPCSPDRIFHALNDPCLRSLFELGQSDLGAPAPPPSPPLPPFPPHHPSGPTPPRHPTPPGPSAPHMSDPKFCPTKNPVIIRNFENRDAQTSFG